MIPKLFLLFIFITPFFGKTLNYLESIIFFSVPPIFFLFLILKKEKLYLPKKIIIGQIILIFLYLVSTIFSKNIGISYYQFFTFLNIILIFSIAVNILKPKDFSSGLVAASLLYSIIFLLNKFGIFGLEKDLIGDNFIPQVWGHSYMAEFIVLSIPILLTQISCAKNKIGLSLVGIIILLSLFLTNSRSAIIALILGLIFLKINQKINNKFKIYLILLSTFALIFTFYKIHLDNQQLKNYDGDRFEYWQQSIHGFSQSPIFGNGPNTFQYINKKFQTGSDLTTISSHSSLLNFLSENGIIFTIIFFLFVTKSLFKTSKKNNCFFVCGLIAVIFSLIDFSWNSPGIFIVSLYFIFYYLTLEKHKKSINCSNIYLLVISILVLLFAFSRTFSDMLFLKGEYQKSLIIDPFNLNSYQEIIKKADIKNPIWQKTLSNSLKLYHNEIRLYSTIVEVVPMSQKELYYQKIIKLNPSYVNNYLQLLTYYQNNNLTQKSFSVFQQMALDIPVSGLSNGQRDLFSKNCYHYAVKLFISNPEQSIFLLEKTVELEPWSGYFQVDLANAYWHTNQKEKAINQLTKCLSYPDSKEQCQEYLSSHQNTEFNRPGSDEFINFVDTHL